MEIDRGCNHFHLLENTFARMPNDNSATAAMVALAFTLPPNLAFSADGFKRLSHAINIGEGRDELANALGYSSISECCKHFDTASTALADYADSAKNDLAQAASSPDSSVILQDVRIGDIMARRCSLSDHPLANYALEHSPLWALFFHEQEDQINFGEKYHKLVCDFVTLSARVIVEVCDHRQYPHWLNVWSQAAHTSQDSPEWPLSDPGHFEAKVFKSRLLTAALALRKLSSAKPNHTSAIEALYVNPGDKLKVRLIQALASFRTESTSWELLHQIDLWLDLIYPDDEPGAGRGGITRGQKKRGFRSFSNLVGYVRIAHSYISDTIQLGEDPIFDSIELLQRTDDGVAELVNDEGFAPDELIVEEIAIRDTLAPEYSNLSLPARNLLVQNDTTQLSRRNQRPTWAWHAVSEVERDLIRKFLLQRQPIACEDLPIPRQYIPDLLIRASLVLGLTPREAAKLELTTAGDELKTGSLYFIRGTNTWQIALHAPRYDSIATSREVRNSRPITNSIHFNDDSGFGQHVKDSGIPDGQLCSRFDTHIEKAIAKRTSIICPDRPLSFGRMKGLLWESILEVTGGDLAIAHLITGQEFAHARTTSHYSTYSHAHISEVYEQAVGAILAKNKSTERFVPPKPKEGGFGGARFCPRTKALMDIISRARQQITRSPAKPVDAVLTYHNAYALYSFFIIGICGAARGVTDPRPDSYIADTGWAIAADKLRNDADRRIYPMPRVGMRQLENYCAHIDALTRRFPRFETAFEDYLFTLTSKSNPLALAPLSQTLWREHTSDLGLPMNCLRHYVRTRLIELGTSPELVDGVMGHWSSGCSPADLHSTIHPESTKKMQTATASILRDLRLTARKSHL